MILQLVKIVLMNSKGSTKFFVFIFTFSVLKNIWKGFNIYFFTGDMTSGTICTSNQCPLEEKS